MEPKWWQKAVIYEIYTKSFKDSDGDGLGDLFGVIEKLPYLKDLGIDCIWFTPIYPSPQVDNGYDVADYEDIEPAYGGMTAFKELLEKAHALGIRVVMDLVLNHSSDECRWFKESQSSRDDPKRDWYIWRSPREDGSEPNNWANKFNDGSGSAWTFDEKTGEYYLHNYAVKMPELNWESRGLREEIYRVIRGWLDMGVDGFRLDVITKLKKPPFVDSPKKPNPFGYVLDNEIQSCNPGLHEIIKELRENTWGLPQYDAFAVGEAGGVTEKNAEEFLSPKRGELETLYHFQIVSRNRPTVTLKAYKEIQDNWGQIFNRGSWTTEHLSNHDQARQVSRFGNDSSEYRKPSARCLAMMTHVFPGTPFVYQGEEIGMTNVYFDSIDDYNDRYTLGDYAAAIRDGMTPEDALRKVRINSRDHARTPMQWDASENAGFTAPGAKPWIKVNPNYREINVSSDRASSDSLFAFYQKLIALRKEETALVAGHFGMYLKEDPHFVVITRTLGHAALLLIANPTNEKAVLSLPEELRRNMREEQQDERRAAFPADEEVGESGCLQELLSSYPGASRDSAEGEYLPWEARLYRFQS